MYKNIERVSTVNVDFNLLCIKHKIYLSITIYYYRCYSSTMFINKKEQGQTIHRSEVIDKSGEKIQT